MHSIRPQSVPPKSFLFRYVPAIDSLVGYDSKTLRADVFAGATVAAVAVPQAMAYALIAGLPVEVGLYTAIVMTFFGALFDSSKQLINGPTNAISIATLSIIAPLSTPETALPTAVLLAFLVGVIQLGIFLLKLGDLSRYISHSVILGFTTGASALLVLDQLKNLAGVPGPGRGHHGFLEGFYHTWWPLPEVHSTTVQVGLCTIAFVIGLRWLKKRLNLLLVPELLLAVVASALWTALGDLDRSGLKVIGEIPRGLPHFELPQFDAERIRSMSSGALALALLGSLEALSMAKAIAAHTRQRLDINQQLLSEGIANLMGSLFQCFPGSGSLTRSAINHQAGAKTQWSGVVSAVLVAVTMMAFAPYARYVPRAALAGILILAAFRMVEWKSLAYHFRVSRFDGAIIVATAVSAVAISVEFCVLIGVLISFVMAVPRIGKVLLTEFVKSNTGYVHERLDSDVRDERVLIFGLEGELFFAAAASLEAKLDQIENALTESTQIVVLRLKRARNPDAVGMNLLEDFLANMKERGVSVVLCGVRPALKTVFDKAGMTGRVGTEKIFVEQPVRQTSTHQALEYAAHQLIAPDA